jgi:hypothetical protein
MKKPTVDTPYKNSWAHQEFLKKHKPVYNDSFNQLMTGKKKIVGYEFVPQVGLHPEFGKRPLMPNEKNWVTLYESDCNGNPIDKV